jgi:hypothetical protein
LTFSSVATASLTSDQNMNLLGYCIETEI